MTKYAKIENQETKTCIVGLGTNSAFYESIGMTEMDVEQAWDGVWYVAGYAPEKPQEVINAERVAELKANLAKTDYVAWKLAEVDGDARQAMLDEYADVLAQRQAWRDEINTLTN